MDHVHVGPGHHVQRLQMPQHHQLAKYRNPADDVVDKTVRVLVLVLKRQQFQVLARWVGAIDWSETRRRSSSTSCTARRTPPPILVVMMAVSTFFIKCGVGRFDFELVTRNFPLVLSYQYRKIGAMQCKDNFVSNDYIISGLPKNIPTHETRDERSSSVI